MINTLNIPIEEFLRSFFDSNEKICLRVFDDRKRGTFKGAKLETSISRMDEIMGTLQNHNGLNRGIYYVVNSGGHEDCDITRINAQFMECDEKSIDEQLAQIEAFPIPPSLIVKTRKSLHTYWLMKNADIKSFRRVQKRLVAHFDGDKTCVNESRVLRLPGFFHCKEERVLVQCVKFNPELRYSQSELEAVLPQVSDDPDRSLLAPKGSLIGLSLVENRCEFIKHCHQNAVNLSEHDWYSMITNLAVFEDGDKAIHGMSAKYSGYNRVETQDKINHFLESGTKPITCKTIAEKGFICPKIGSEECGARAPAALCYKALSIEDLRLFLKIQEVKKAPVDNIQTIQGFIKSYLYNVDSMVAATFIEYEMKDYFEMKAGAMKPLTIYQKELYRAYRANRETKKEISDEELPAWYEPTERGGLHFMSGLLANHLAENVDAFYSASTYYFYANGVYGPCDDMFASSRVREHMIPRYANMTAISDTMGQWKMLIIKAVREINCNPFIINMQNGLYNVIDDGFKPHTPKYYSTVQIKASYQLDVKCPQFLVFLNSVLKEPEIYLMQEILGYFLIPVNKAQKSFVFVGAGNAGKSTLLSVVQEILLGSENVSNITWQNLGDRFNKAELFGKLANIFADLPSKSIDDNGMFKALTGEDYITAERKNKDPFSFRPYARLLFSCNDIPRNYGDRSDGFYRRLIIIRFDHAVPKAKRDPNLREKLMVERDGILMWALIGLKRLITNSYMFTETDVTNAELQRYKVESNSVLSFAEDFCVMDDTKETSRDDLFSKYKDYCNTAGLKPLSQANFNKDIEGSFVSVKRSRDRLSKRRTWKGIAYCEGGKDTD